MFKFHKKKIPSSPFSHNRPQFICKILEKVIAFPKIISFSTSISYERAKLCVIEKLYKCILVDCL